ncbi:hypothetical protein MH117_03030 [Paenibacillus sp. ACRRX]|uniref:hypothetical protein n=1 Tax=Paenibacillus sp. ACRRX TaxID=2918206 RepID=UPI001EF54C28|nr:hypothetical protein [Paenibacillus sp. ACRRX]
MANTQEIKLPIDLQMGTFNKTILKDGKLQLSEITKDDKGNTVYEPSGTWESSIIPIHDQVASFHQISSNTVVSGNGGSYTIYVQSSADKITWSPYVEVDVQTGNMQTPKNKFVRIKIEFSSSPTDATFTVDAFDKGKYNKETITSNTGALGLKKEYTYKYEFDGSWKGTGTLLRKKIEHQKFKKINALEVIKK